MTYRSGYMKNRATTRFPSGADGRTRTGDLLFTKQLLYQLSYVGILDL